MSLTCHPSDKDEEGVIPMMFKKLAGDRSGATAIEYGLIAALIAIAIATAATNVGESLTKKFEAVNTKLGGTN